MTTLSLSCPLCCNETFNSHDSLKYHLLSMVDNLFCPACDKRFDNILELAEHVGRECKDTKETGMPLPKQIKVEALETQTSQLSPEVAYDENNTEFSQENHHFEQVFIPKQEANNYDENPSEENENQLLYTCQMCNVSFNSIEEHLQKFHDGEEVLLETENDEDAPELTVDGSMLLYQDEDDQFEEDEGRNENGTVSEEHCVDKNGQVYTRKVVKIDNFWTDKQTENSPMTEKYLLEDGKIKKISDQEASAMSNKSQIIEIHQCPKCYLQFPALSHYKNHKCNPNATKNKSKFRCMYCTSVYLNIDSLNEHMKSHNIEEAVTKEGKIQRTVTIGPHVCEICNTMFPSYKSLRLHKRMHEPVKSKEVEAPVTYNITGPKDDDTTPAVRHMFLCCICNKTYDKEYEEVHMKSHSDMEDFICSVCNRKFFTKENLEMHMKAHSNGKKFACSYCKKPFTTHDALQEHVKNQCQKRQYECQYCGRRFARPHEKVKHERIHTGEKPHVCQVCGKAFRVSYCLTLHMRTHSGTRPYECSHCGKRFKSHSVYNHHLLTHSEARNYKCPYCPKAFKTGVQLAGHKNSHTKPFSCTECNRPFASLYAVRAHMETHKRENNLKYDCWLCGATYARSFALKDHMKTQHAGYSITGDQEVDDSMLIELETAASADQIEQEMSEIHGEYPERKDDEEEEDEEEEGEEQAVDEDESMQEYEEHEGEMESESVHVEAVEAAA